MASPYFALKGKPLLKYSLFYSTDIGNSTGLCLFYYFTSFLSILGYIFFIKFVVPPGWTSQLWILQYQVVPNHMGYLILLGALVPPSFVLLALVRHKVTLLSLCLLLVNIVALAFIGIKSYLVIGLATALLTWAAVRAGKVQMKYLVITAVVLIGFMIMYDRFIDIFAQTQFAGSKFPAALSFLERPYLYIVGSWPAMSVTMSSPLELVHWGQTTLEPVWKILGPGGLGIIMERVPHSLPFVNIGPSYFNVYSLIGEIYLDYGWLGSILGCFILGFISTKLYIKAYERGDWVLYLLSAIFSYGLFISFFAYYYRSDLIFLLLYVLIVGRLSKRLSTALNRHKIWIHKPLVTKRST
jgi:oligosaccharide repeat unit polymerase